MRLRMLSKTDPALFLCMMLFTVAPLVAADSHKNSINIVGGWNDAGSGGLVEWE